jgi:hypothetical protein
MMQIITTLLSSKVKSDDNIILFEGTDIECMNYIDTHDIITEICGIPATKSDLEEYFKKVQNKDNWKNPINAFVPEKDEIDLEAYKKAITFFTGSVATCTPVGKGTLIVADGYYISIGA